MTNNAFFNLALRQASRVLGRKKRLLMLIGTLGYKLRALNWKEINHSDVRDKFFTIGRLLKAYADGSYREVPLKSMLLVTGAIMYFIMPVDVIPDVIPALGFTDDFGILLAVYHTLRAELDKFIAWEKTKLAEL